MKYSKS